MQEIREQEKRNQEVNMWQQTSGEVQNHMYGPHVKYWNFYGLGICSLKSLYRLLAFYSAATWWSSTLRQHLKAPFLFLELEVSRPAWQQPQEAFQPSLLLWWKFLRKSASSRLWRDRGDTQDTWQARERNILTVNAFTERKTTCSNFRQKVVDLKLFTRLQGFPRTSNVSVHECLNVWSYFKMTSVTPAGQSLTWPLLINL